MNVKLISISKPVEDCTTAEDMIAYVARVSNPENQNNMSNSSNLIKYLIKHKHWSPFELVNMTLEINTTRDISRQILRHRSFSFQEFSQRYADPTKSLEFSTREFRLQDKTNRQNSIELNGETAKHYSNDMEIWEALQNNIIKESLSAYEWAISKGIAKEQARVVLPEGLMHTKLYMSGSLRSWLHYCELRMGNGTQKEHRLIAEKCWDIVSQQFPSISEAIKELKEKG
jgi:thymidylate synthase (FAD)